MADYGWLDWGRDYYAAVSFSNVPDGRRLMIGWMNNWQYAASTPSSGWRSAMSLVREVKLVSRGGRPLLVQEARGPVRRPRHGAVRPGSAAVGGRGDAGFQPRPAATCCESMRNSSPATASRVGLVLRAGSESGGASRSRSGPGAGARIVLAYDCLTTELSLDRTESGNVGFHEAFASVERVAVPLEDGRLRLRVFLDRCSVEVFAQDGLATITDLVFPGEARTALAVFAAGGRATLVSLDVVR